MTADYIMTPAVVFSILILILLIKPTGLLGKTTDEPARLQRAVRHMEDGAAEIRA